LGFDRKISVRQLFFAQDRKGVVDQESRRVEHDQNFGEQRFHRGLACFLCDTPRDIGLVREKNLLKTPHHPDAIADAPGVPFRLCRVRARDRRAYFGRTGTVQFAQNFTRRRVHGSDARNGEFDISGHLRRSVLGTEPTRQRLILLANCRTVGVARTLLSACSHSNPAVGADKSVRATLVFHRSIPPQPDTTRWRARSARPPCAPERRGCGENLPGSPSPSPSAGMCRPGSAPCDEEIRCREPCRSILRLRATNWKRKSSGR